eukprot:g28777.t1
MEPQEVGEVLNEHFTLVITKEKHVDDGKIKERYVDILGHVNIKKEEELEVTKIIDVGRAVHVDYMDFGKAFDKGSYGRLVQKIKSQCIQ